MLALPPAEPAMLPGFEPFDLGEDAPFLPPQAVEAAAPPPSLPAATEEPDPASYEDYTPPYGVMRDPSVRRGAAVAILASATGAAAGGVVGGPYGVAAGLLAGGALVNLLRAWRTFGDPLSRGEAVRSGIVGAVGLGVSGYLVYRATRRSE